MFSVTSSTSDQLLLVQPQGRIIKVKTVCVQMRHMYYTWHLFIYLFSCGTSLCTLRRRLNDRIFSRCPRAALFNRRVSGTLFYQKEKKELGSLTFFIERLCKKHFLSFSPPVSHVLLIPQSIQRLKISPLSYGGNFQP